MERDEGRAERYQGGEKRADMRRGEIHVQEWCEVGRGRAERRVMMEEGGERDERGGRIQEDGGRKGGFEFTKKCAAHSMRSIRE